MKTKLLILAALALSLAGQAEPQKFSDLPAAATADSTDIFPFTDISASATKKITLANLKLSLAFTKADLGLGNVLNVAQEPNLGVPNINGYVLSSTTAGVRSWVPMTSGGGASGTVTSVSLTAPSGFTISGSPVTSSGTLAIATTLSGLVKGTGSGFTTATAGADYLAPSGDGSALTGITAAQVGASALGHTHSFNSLTAKPTTLAGYGIIDAADAAPVQSVAGKTGVVTLGKADVGLPLVENTALSTWAGSANLTTLGTITSGTWQGAAIADAKIASATAWNAKQNALTAGTDYLTPAGAAAAYQPVDSDLTSIAALSTTSFGRSLLTQADAATARTTIGAGTSNFNGSAASLTGILPVANGGTGTATPALVAGTNVTITGTWPNQTINSTASGGGSFDPTAPGPIGATTPSTISSTGLNVVNTGADRAIITYGGASFMRVGAGNTTLYIHYPIRLSNQSSIGFDFGSDRYAATIQTENKTIASGVLAAIILKDSNTNGGLPIELPALSGAIGTPTTGSLRFANVGGLLTIAGTGLAVRNSTTGQALTVSRSYTDASNYSQVSIDATGSVGVIKTVTAGTPASTVSGVTIILPTSPGPSGSLWNNGGNVAIVP